MITARAGRHAAPALHGPLGIGALATAVTLLAAWLISLLRGPQHTTAAISRAAARARMRGWRSWPLGVRVALIGGAALGLVLVFATIGAVTVGVAAGRVVGSLLSGGMGVR